MTRFVASQLRFRHGRALALASGLLVAGVAFTILTASAHTAAFRTRGTITRNYRTAYDAWKAKAQATVDNARIRYFVVHLHRLLQPDDVTQTKARGKA